METSARYQGEFDNLKATELTLGLPGTHHDVDEQQPKRPSQSNKRAPDNSEANKSTSESAEAPAKVQVVGWPPIRSYRKNNTKVRKIEGDDEATIVNNNGGFVKVSMDGAPYLRKIDLKMYKSYKELRETLENMFKCFSLGEYAITYEDKDGDWMLVGDVPWGMFISSCKRLRIMKGSEARGLASTSSTCQ